MLLSDEILRALVEPVTYTENRNFLNRETHDIIKVCNIILLLRMITPIKDYIHLFIVQRLLYFDVTVSRYTKENIKISRVKSLFVQVAPTRKYNK